MSETNPNMVQESGKQGIDSVPEREVVAFRAKIADNTPEFSQVFDRIAQA